MSKKEEKAILTERNNIQRNRLIHTGIFNYEIRDGMREEDQKPIQFYLSNNDYGKIYQYLKNPISTGLWFLECKWKSYTESITNDIYTDVLNVTDHKFEENEKENLINILTKISFILQIFYLMSNSDDAKGKNKFRPNREYRFITDLLDINKYRDKYKDSLEYFKNNIIIENYTPAIYEKQFSLIKEGIVISSNEKILNKENGERIIKFISLEPVVPEKLKIFFTMIDKISDSKIYPVYSPEEDIFESYHLILKIGYENFIEKGKLKDLIQQSISIYDSGNYTYCINTIGLMLEEQLIQIYETLFREKCPPGTIGEIYDLIERKIKEKFIVDIPKKINYDGVYNIINNSINNPDKITHNNILEISRNIIMLLQESNKDVLSKIKITKNTEFKSIFAANIREVINELLKYRNAVSHTSRIPIGSYEAIKSMYSITALIIWWKEERNKLDWKKTPDEIILQLIEENNPINLK